MTLSDPDFVALQTALRGRFSIEHELGRGGMGIVYLARDVQLQRPVAIKLLAPALAANANMRSRFLHEARLAALCFHPHIVPVHHVDESGTLAWFVMAYVRGESLAERVKRTGPLSAENVRRMAQDIGWALSYAHERGVVHRDVKPENILIDAASERFLLADFGIALRSDASPDDVSAGTDGLHSPAWHRREHTPGIIGAGTPRYMAPEQARGDAVDGRADLYALGASLFFSATGRAPFEASSSSALMYQHATALAPNIRVLAPALAQNVADAIDQCLAKIPDDRFPSAAAFVDAIKPQETQHAVPASLRPAQSNMAGAKSTLGWAAVIGSTSVLLMIGESGHSFNRDFILVLGASIAGFMMSVSALRAVEATVATRRALRAGVATEDAINALTTTEAPPGVERPNRKRSAWLIGVGAALAISQGHIARIDGLPEALEALLQVGLLFGPVYLVGRGAAGITSGTRVGSWLRQHIERPIALMATKLAGAFLPVTARKVPVPVQNAPTELRLGLAVRSALARLPLQQQQLMAGTIAAADGLAAEADRLRKEDGRLEAAERLARQAVTDDERTQVLGELKRGRQAVQNRLATAVAALETMRLDLMRLEMNDGERTGLTTQLGVVRDIAHRVDAAAELRAYLAHSTPTPV